MKTRRESLRSIEERNRLAEENLGLFGLAYKRIRRLRPWLRITPEEYQSALMPYYLRALELWNEEAGAVSTYVMTTLGYCADRALAPEIRLTPPYSATETPSVCTFCDPDDMEYVEAGESEKPETSEEFDWVISRITHGDKLRRKILDDLPLQDQGTPTISGRSMSTMMRIYIRQAVAEIGEEKIREMLS